MIQLKTLGRLELSDGEGSDFSALLTQPKRFALLVYLALPVPGTMHRRDTLVGLFWPELDQARARTALRNSLSHIRHVLGQNVVVRRGDEEVGIDLEVCSCDVTEFEVAIGNGAWGTALGLYRGHLLEGFFVSNAGGFERWLEDERTRLRELAAGAAWAHAHQHIEADRPVDAERTAQRALTLVATDESEVRRFINALAAAGERASAIRFYDKFAERLKGEYELEPASETRQLVEEVRNRSDAANAVGAVESGSRQVSTAEAGTGPPSRGAAQEKRVVSRHLSKVALRWAAAVSVVIVLAVAIAVGWTSGNRANDVAFVPNRVVVALFENQTGDSSLTPLALMAADWITDGLARTGMVEVITPAAVREASAAAESRGARWSGSEGPLALAEMMHAGIVVSGRLYRAAEELTIHAQVVRLPGATLLGPIEPVSLASPDPDAALETLRQRVMGLLAIHLDPRLADRPGRTRRPPVFDAYLEFVAGMEPGGPVRERIGHLLKSATLDSTFMAPLINAVRRSGGVGYAFAPGAFRDSVLEVIEQRQHLLTPIERYEVAATGAWFECDITDSYTAWRNAAQLAPDLLTELSRVAYASGRYRVAVETLERPDLPVGFRPYPWKRLTAALHFLGEHERELEAARRGRSEEPESMSLMEQEATALVALGRIDELEATLEEGFLTGTDPRARAKHWTLLFFQAGNELLWHGYENEGRAVLERVVAHLRGEPEDAGYGLLLARTLLFLGHYEEARAISEQLVSERREAGRLTPGLYLEVAGMAAAGLGDRETALRISAELAGDAPTPHARWAANRYRAEIAGALGDCEAAVELLEESVTMCGEHNMIHRRFGFMNCRDYPPFQEFAKPRG